MRLLALSFFVVITVCAVAVPAEVGAGATAEPTGPAGPIDLPTALRLALERSPALEAMSARVGQAAARSTQAALIPNPALRFELEDFAGSGAFAGADEAQATFTIEQPIELGGKRAARIQAANSAATVVAADYASARREVVAATTRAFVGLQHAQSAATLADETLRVAEQLVASVEARVRAGSSSRVERTQAEIALAEARIDNQRSHRALAIARQRLAATWGDTEPRFASAAAEGGAIRPPPALTTLLARLPTSPAVARAADEIARREAGVAVARSASVPDLELGLGYRRMAGPDENAMVAELRVPLPIFDRNQAGVIEARERVAGAHADHRSVEAQIAAELREAHEALTMAHDEIGALDATVLPAATTAFDAIRDGYREGRFSYLDLLAAERTLNAARLRRIDAVAAYHVALAEIARLTGEGE
jgi:cobalt-zinc-cadmium efflux system outer membrane protein